jgi:glyoxylase-like metal-dependent hydrolase (beta-lactamase superfamily II)
MNTAASFTQDTRSGAVRPEVSAFFEERTCSVQYVVRDPGTRCCALIDPVLDYDEKSGSVSTRSADALLAFCRAGDLTVEWILDTHPHADHLSAAGYLKDVTGATTAIGAHVVDIQNLWKAIYHLDGFRADGSQWDRLFADGDTFRIGAMEVGIMHSPGHTLASVTYLAGDCAFIHDSLLMPDFGTARCDFPGGSAKSLWRSIQRILALPDETRLFVGHDYKPGGRAPAWESTVGVQKACNVHLAHLLGQHAPGEDAFIRLRQERDAKLPMPKLILHALQVNMAGGRLPSPEANGTRYLRIPIDTLPCAVWD